MPPTVSGGGIYNTSGGTLTINDSTVTGNGARYGGGIFSHAELVGKATISNSTISGNIATASPIPRAEGFYSRSGITVIENSTITNNTAPSGAGSGVVSRGDNSARTEIRSTIVSANTNTDVDFVDGTVNSFVSKGFNLTGDGNATGAFAQGGDVTGNASPGLGPLASNGGPTQTHALLATSPALDEGANAGCPPTDQRGLPRPQGETCDIGAFERLAPTPTDIVNPPTAHYQFRNSRASSVGGVPALADIGSGTNTFATAAVDGASSTVLRFPKGNGLRLSPTTRAVSNNTYTIVALFELNFVNGFRRVVDFKSGTSDNGLYLQSGLLRFFPSVQGTTPVAANAYVQVALTRDAAGTVVGYVNGVQQFSFSDASNHAVIDTSNALRFFKDNTSGGAGGEESAGSVARIRLYDSALTAEQVAALDRLDTTPPAVSSTTPASNATNVAPTANVTATFTEPMRAGTIATATVKLRRLGESTSVPATVTYSAATTRATLNPSANLVAGATYTATVTSGAMDVAGNELDQNLGLADDQPETWRFKVRP